MAEVIDKAFGKGCKFGTQCEECVKVKARLGELVETYPKLKSHLENVFKTRAVTLVFDEDAFYTAEANTLHVPHTGKADDWDDMVDGFIFESYNATRRDKFTNAAESKAGRDLVHYGTLTATIESDTIGDFYKLASSMKEEHLTRGMRRCIMLAKEAKGSVAAHFLASPHVTDPEKLKKLPPNHTGRLPTKVLYIYEAIEGLGLRGLKETILTKLNLPFRVTKKGFKSTLEVEGNDGPKRQQAEKLLELLDSKNWPLRSKFKQRPYALLQIIAKIKTEGDYDQLKGVITQNAFGYDSSMVHIAGLNRGDFSLG